MEYRIIGDDGNEYGPAGLDTLRQWAVQGRVSRLTMVQRSDSGRWAHAENYAELDGFLPKAVQQAPDPLPTDTRPPEPPPASPPPIAVPPEVVGASSIRPAVPAAGHAPFALPGRGDTILALGLVSLLSSTIFSCLCIGIVIGPATGIPAWIMGAGDLRKIDAGLISPLERANTKGGMICGIIGTFFGPIIGALVTLLSVIPFIAGLQ